MIPIDRRAFLCTTSAMIALGSMPPALIGKAAAQPAQPAAPAAVPFSRAWLIEEARRIAAEPYAAPEETVPRELAEIGYDQYRDIRFRPDARIWGSETLPFTLDLFHPGFIYRTPVRVSLVEAGVASELRFSPDYYFYGPGVPRPADPSGLFFSGIRVRAPVNAPDVWDEFLVIQGASYFRSLARGQQYGLSARAVAIDTAEPKGEEFPSFTHLWIEKPDPHGSVLVIHGLVDSPSMTGAYQFSVIPGAETLITVEAAIFARQQIGKIGVAPLSSMFMFDSSNRAGHDDFRPAVHDSDGLQILTSTGEWIWRQLANPRDLQISAFGDRRPRGFGLVQRKRDYADFEDAQARYELRPSIWIEPFGDWGPGYVELVEIPTPNEYNDNIVVYWKPDGAVPPGGPYHYAYRMRWTDSVRPERGLITVRRTRVGLTGDGERKLFVIDFDPPPDDPRGRINVEATASAGVIARPVVHDPAPDGTLRVSFELDPAGAEISELRLRLVSNSGPVSETWLYRWTA